MIPHLKHIKTKQHPFCRRVFRLILSTFFLMFLGGLSSTELYAQTASFTVQPVNGSLCIPAQVRFVPTFSQTPVAVNWQFGVAGAESVAQSPTYTYTAVGTYRVVLSVLFDSTLAEVEQFVTVNASTPITLQRDRNFICTPGNVNFTVQTTGNVVSTAWNFGDGSAVSTQPGTTATHFFNDFRSYTVRATSTNQFGCTSTATTTFALRQPTANLSATPSDGCLPANVRLRAQIGAPAGTTVTRFTWNFGDGSPARITTGNNVLHRYTTEAGGRPSVTIVTSEGCTNTYIFDSLSFGNPPQNPRITASDTIVCFSGQVDFTGFANNANLYRWNFQDGTPVISTQDTTISHRFANRGTFTVRLTPVQNGCAGTSDSIVVDVVGPAASFGFSNTCNDKATFSFSDSSTGNISSYNWRFLGPGGSELNQQNPVFTFPQSGAHPVRLIISDAVTGCFDTANTIIYTANPRLQWVDTFACKNANVRIAALNTYVNPDVLYDFVIGGVTSNNRTPANRTLAVPNSGVFNNRIVIRNGPGYCNDTLVQPVPLRVSGPTAGFTLPANICLSDSLLPTDTSSTGFVFDRITQWRWSFNNNEGVDSNQVPRPFSFAASGTFDVKLRISDTNGCMDSVTHPILVRSLPFLSISPASRIVCAAADLSLNAVHQGSIRWQPTALVDCDTCSNVNIRPLVSTVYQALATDTFGCVNQFEVNVDVYQPYPFNPILSDTGVCAGQPVFFNTGLSGQIYNWTPAVGLSNPNVPNPTATPTVTTTYTLNVIDSAGCFPNSAQVTVAINPFPQVTMPRDTVIGFDAPFILQPLYGQGIVGYRWLPPDGLTCIDCPAPEGRGRISTRYVLEATTEAGCVDTFSTSVFISCTPDNILMPTAFTPNGDNLNDVYYPITRGVQQINKFVIFNRAGQVVFERFNFRPNDRSFGWNGSFKGQPQPSGNYIYMVEVLCDLGEPISAKGNVMLIR